MNKLKLCLIVSIIFNIILIFSNKKNVVRPMNNFNVLLTDILNCTNKNSKPKVSQKNGFYVLYNFIEGDVKVDYEETITLTAPADVRFLNNIVPLAIRWQAPMSIAVYTPGHDFYTALKVIAYLRSCTTPEIKQFVTFHLFFDEGHLPNVGKFTSLSILNYYYKFYYFSQRSRYWKPTRMNTTVTIKILPKRLKATNCTSNRMTCCFPLTSQETLQGKRPERTWCSRPTSSCFRRQISSRNSWISLERSPVSFGGTGTCLYCPCLK